MFKRLAQGTRPEIIAECQRFRACLRKDNFLNPINSRIVCKSLGDGNELSSKLMNLTDLAKKSRQEYIIEVFYNNNPTPFFRPIRLPNKKHLHKKMKLICRKEKLLSK